MMPLSPLMKIETLVTIQGCSCIKKKKVYGDNSALVSHTYCTTNVCMFIATNIILLYE